MAGPKASTALMVALSAPSDLALNAAGQAPELVMLLPAGATIVTVDGRGPYRVRNAAQLVADSLKAGGNQPMPIDENHSTDLAAPKGGPSPARGWITSLQAREDGSIWAPVEWTGVGKQLVADKAYRGVSVVFEHLADGTITRIKRASLVNNPNLRGLVALNAEGANMDLLAELRKLLGLPDDADQAAVMAKINALKDGAQTATQATALQAQIASIGKAAGAADGADAATVLAAVTTLAATAKGAPGAEVVTALQAELKTVTTELNTLKTSRATEKATAYVDGEIAKGRVGVKPLREHYIAMHAADPARVEKEIGAFPFLSSTGALETPPAVVKDGKVALNAEEKSVARALGIAEDDYAKTLAAERAAA